MAYAFNQAQSGADQSESQDEYIPISNEELMYAEKGDRMAFWRSRLERGDPMAATALGITAVLEGDMAAILGMRQYSVLGLSANKFLEWRAGQVGLSIDLDKVGNNLMHAHIDNYQAGGGRVLTARQITEYHHEVFGRMGLPNNAFGGTPLTGHTFEDRLTRHIWYRREE